MGQERVAKGGMQMFPGLASKQSSICQVHIMLRPLGIKLHQLRKVPAQCFCCFENTWPDPGWAKNASRSLGFACLVHNSSMMTSDGQSGLSLTVAWMALAGCTVIDQG